MVFNHKVRHSRCVHKLTRVERMYFYNTTLFDGRSVYSFYYIRYNYMFRRLKMDIFRLYMKYLLSSYTKLIWAVYMGRVGGEMGMRSRMYHRGWEL